MKYKELTILLKLVTFVVSIPMYLCMDSPNMFDFTAAAYSYYRTLSQKESLDRRGLTNDQNKMRRRQERLGRVSV